MDTPNQYMMIPRLDFKNFVSWRCRILSVLEAKNLDSLLREEEPTSAEAKILFKKRDAECRGLLLCTINDEIVSLLLTCKSSREIWNSLTSRFESDLKKQSITARNDLHRIQMKETESLTDFLFRGEKMWQSTLILGSDVGEEEFLGALVKGILPKYNIIALQIATMEKPTVADVRRIFQIHQERNELKEKQEYSKAYHMDCRQNRNTNEYEEGCERRRNDRNRRIVCFTCHRAGHRQIDCWQNKKKENIREETKRLTQKFQKVKIAKDENPQVERKPEKTFFIRSSKITEEKLKGSASLIKYPEDNRFEEKLSDKIQTTQKIFPEIQKMDNNCSEDMENILKEHLIEIEARLERKYSEELLSVKKEADERILKAEIQSNLKLEEFQEIFNEKLNQINSESEEKIKKAMEEKKIVQDELLDFTTQVKGFLSRAFPNVNLQESDEKKIYLSEYEEVKSHLERLDKNMTGDPENLENMLKELGVKADEKSSLQSRIMNYQNVLFGTDKILRKLQCNIENDAKRWIIELQRSDKYQTGIQDENRTLEFQEGYLQTTPEKGKEIVLKAQEEETIKDFPSTNCENVIPEVAMVKNQNSTPDEDGMMHNRNLSSQTEDQNSSNDEESEKRMSIGQNEDKITKLQYQKDILESHEKLNPVRLDWKLGDQGTTRIKVKMKQAIEITCEEVKNSKTYQKKSFNRGIT